MTTPQTDAEVPIPWMPQKSTSLRLAHMDPRVFRTDDNSHFYKIIDAMCGDAGVGDLKKELLVKRFQTSLDSTNFTDLDTIFGGAFSLSRLDFETHNYDVDEGLLTSDQWDEVRIKDAWFRERCRSMLQAFQLGGTPDGFRMAVHAITGVDCDLFEIWKYIDNYGITTPMGRLGQSIRNEVVIKPHLATLDPKTKRLILLAIDKIKPVDCVVTVDVNGLAIHIPITPLLVSADSSYFEIKKTVTGIPDLAKLPKPDVLAKDIKKSQQWLQAGVPKTAPHGAHNTTQEYSYYYLYSPDTNSPVDTVVYQSEDGDGTRKTEKNYQSTVTLSSGYGPWTNFEIADSPDNYPGGKNGLTPGQAPALSPSGGPYHFPYESQADYVTQMTSVVLSRGGQVTDVTYRLPDTQVVNIEKFWTPAYVFPVSVPTRFSSVVGPWRKQKPPPGQIYQPFN